MWPTAFRTLLVCSQLSSALDYEPLRFRGTCMGTTYAVTIADQLDAPSVNEIATQVGDELERIEQIFSLYRPNSELSRFNESTSTGRIEVSTDLLSVAKHALDLAGQTNGAFDPTVAPLIRLWRLRQVKSGWLPPNQAAIDETKKLVDFRLLATRATPPALRKLTTGIELDLNALVEGWAIDQVIHLLREANVKNAVVELGGEFRALGHKSSGQPWKIGIENPSRPDLLYATVRLENAALATSGNYRQAIEFKSRHYGHILDARTGKPVEHDLIAVSVLASDAMTADGWATALLVLGAADGFALAEKTGTAASFVSRVGAGIQIKITTSARGRFLLVDQ